MVLEKQGVRQQLNRFCQAGYLFLVAWVVYMISNTAKLSAWVVLNGSHGFTRFLNSCWSVAHVLFLAVVLLNLIAGRYSRRALIFLMVSGVLSLIGWHFSNHSMMALHWLIITAAYGVDGKKVLKSGLIVQAAVVFTIILLAVSGVTENYLFEPEGRARYSLGFSWALLPPCLFFFLFLLYTQLRKGKITWAELGASEAIAVVLYIFTDSRMSLLLHSAVIVFLVIQKARHFRWKWTKPIFRHGGKIIVGISLLSILMPLLPQGKLYDWLNELLSDRLVLGKNAITNYGFSFFGKPFSLIGHSIKNPNPVGYNYIDCAYLQMLIKFGTLFFIIGVALYVIGIKKAYERGDNFFAFALLVIALYGVTDAVLFNYAFNILPVLIFCDEDPLYYFKMPKLSCFLRGKRKKGSEDVATPAIVQGESEPVQVGEESNT